MTVFHVSEFDQPHGTFVEISREVIARYQLRTQKSWWDKSGRNCTLSAFPLCVLEMFSHAHSVMMGFNQEILSIEWNRGVRDYSHSFLHEIPGLHGLQPQLSLAQTFPLEFLGARASHFLSECRISRCTSWRVVTDLPWNSTHTVPCLMLFPMIAAYLLWEMQVYRNTIHSDCLGYSKRKLPHFRNWEPIFIRDAEYSSQLCWILEGVCSSKPQSIIWAYCRTQIPCCACFKS